MVYYCLFMSLYTVKLDKQKKLNAMTIEISITVTFLQKPSVVLECFKIKLQQNHRLLIHIDNRVSMYMIFSLFINRMWDSKKLSLHKVISTKDAQVLENEAERRIILKMRYIL